MKITKNLIEYIAHLSRLELKPDEVDLYTEQIDRILHYMDTLNRIDTDGIDPTSHVVPFYSSLREDIVRNSLSIEEAIKNAPRQRGNFFEVPPIIEVEE